MVAAAFFQPMLGYVFGLDLSLDLEQFRVFRTRVEVGLVGQPLAFFALFLVDTRLHSILRA